MAEVQIKRVSVKHDAILDYMLVNPGIKLGLVAKHFDVSQAWLSVIIHSDAFQERLTEKDAEQFSAIVIPLREKLMGVASLGVEKMEECLQNASSVTDKQFIVDTTDSILKNLGYSPKAQVQVDSGGGSVTQNNFYVADKGTLEAARAKMRAIPAQEPEALEGELTGEAGASSTE